MVNFTENLCEGIYKEAFHKWTKYRENKDTEDWGDLFGPDNIEYWIAKTAYEWALNGIVR